MIEMRRRSLLGLSLGVAVASAASPALARSLPMRWGRSWSSAQQVAEPHNALPAKVGAEITLRQCVRLTLDGWRVRVRFSNLFGAEPLTITAARIGRPLLAGASTADPTSDLPLRFDGRADVIIPAGAEYLSDPVPLRVEQFDNLLVTSTIAAVPAVQTSHPGARATSHVLPGDQSAELIWSGATAADHWWFLSGVDVETTIKPGVVVIGDSITDGYGVQPNTNTRWTDFLAERMARDRAGLWRMSVLNAGLGGNRLLADGVGPGVLSRFERDVLGVPGVGHAIVLIGVNDLGVMSRDALDTPEAMTGLSQQMTSALAQIVQRGRDGGVRMIGGTITPFVGSDYYHPGATGETARQAVNSFIRTSGAFDGVIDFDAALRDPGDPSRLLAVYDNDHLHPTVAGYRAMAEAVDLALFD
ncbi:MAG: SGNH/GDSL hydrolase family protein [Brevundimonas sp.]|nr:MAG: SGNH/GDSL hydrolase family protein [Brevundimonas sp.]